MDLFATIFGTLDATLDQYVHQAVVKATQFVDGPIEIMATLSVMFMGTTLILGMSAFSLKELLKTFGIIAVVFALAGNVGHYNAYLGDHLHELPNELLHVFAVGEAPGSHDNVGATLDEYAETAMDGIGTIWAAGGITDLGWNLLAIALAGLFVWFGVAVCIALGIAMVGSSLVIGIGPIMIVGLLFQSTREYFTRWVSYALQFAILAAFVGAVLGILQVLLDRFLDILANQTANIDLNELLSPAVVMAISGYLFGQLPSMASSVSGGIGLSMGNTAWKGLSKAAQSTIFHSGGKHLQAHGQAAQRQRIESSVDRQKARAKWRDEKLNPNKVDDDS